MDYTLNWKQVALGFRIYEVQKKILLKDKRIYTLINWKQVALGFRDLGSSKITLLKDKRIEVKCCFCVLFLGQRIFIAHGVFVQNVQGPPHGQKDVTHNVFSGFFFPPFSEDVCGGFVVVVHVLVVYFLLCCCCFFFFWLFFFFFSCLLFSSLNDISDF